jgi:signal transduction histidine kinase
MAPMLKEKRGTALPFVCVLLTIPAAISCVVTVLSLLVGVGAIAGSSGPGWGALRWFGIAAFAAALYGLAAVASTIDVGPTLRPLFGKLGGTGASTLTAAWFVYFAASRNRPLARWERWVVGTLCTVAVLWLVPGLCRTDHVFHRTVPWLDVTYTTTRPTVFGQLTWLVLAAATITLIVRLFMAARRGETGARMELFAVVIQFITGLNDAFAASGRADLPYLLDSGQFVVVLSIGTTLITRFVADARALRAAQAELVRRERLAALGELSAVVAHEVRNPVTVIFNAVSTLRKEVVSPDAATLLNIVNEEANRLKRVAGELLDFARPRELVIEPIPPAHLVKGSVDAAITALGTDDKVDIQAADDAPDFQGDEQLLRQALINLITNAIQASGRKGPVRVEIATNAGAIAFHVHDDGIGISKDVADKMFTPFFTTRASGTGLGLAIVRRIAEAHGGDVTWTRGAECGVTFTLKVPLTRA